MSKVNQMKRYIDKDINSIKIFMKYWKLNNF